MQPYHAADDGRWAEKRIGAERIATTYAFRSLTDAGAALAIGSDWTVAPLDPVLGVDAAVTRRTIDGAYPEGWVPAQRITLEEMGAFLNEQGLSKRKWPEQIEFVDALPMNATGKVLKKQLRAELTARLPAEA